MMFVSNDVVLKRMLPKIEAFELLRLPKFCHGFEKNRFLGNKSAKSKNSKLPRRAENPKSTLTTPRDKTWVRPPPSVKSDRAAS